MAVRENPEEKKVQEYLVGLNKIKGTQGQTGWKKKNPAFV